MACPCCQTSGCSSCADTQDCCGGSCAACITVGSGCCTTPVPATLYAHVTAVSPCPTSCTNLTVTLLHYAASTGPCPNYYNSDYWYGSFSCGSNITFCIYVVCHQYQPGQYRWEAWYYCANSQTGPFCPTPQNPTQAFIPTCHPLNDQNMPGVPSSCCGTQGTMSVTLSVS